MGVIAPNASFLGIAPPSGRRVWICYLSSGAGPGSSHAIGVSAPFTVWAVVPLLGGEVLNTQRRRLWRPLIAKFSEIFIVRQ